MDDPEVTMPTAPPSGPSRCAAAARCRCPCRCRWRCTCPCPCR